MTKQWLPAALKRQNITKYKLLGKVQRDINTVRMEWDADVRKERICIHFYSCRTSVVEAYLEQTSESDEGR